jgi:hypothetical protein
MAKVEYSKEFLQISSQLKLSEEEKKKGWTGAVDGAGEQKQVLVFEKAGKFFALTNSGAKPLEGVKDIDSAKTLAKQNITGKPDFGGLNFSDEALAAMSKTREGGGVPETAPAGADVKPAAAGAAADPVARQAQWAKLLAANPQSVYEATGKDGKPVKILIISQDGGKNYFAIGPKLDKPLQLKPTTSKDLKAIYEENKAEIEAAGITDEPVAISGPVQQNTNTAGVQQNAPADTPAGAPPVATPTSVLGRAGNGANYTADPATTEGGAVPEGGAAPEGGVMPTAAPVTGQPAPVGA